MSNADLSDITRAYEIASLWRPEKRANLLANVVAQVFADADSDGGFAAIHNYGEEHLLHFDIHSGKVTDASDHSNPLVPGSLRSQLSPDGNYRIDVRDHNLWLVDLRSSQEKQLTSDGTSDYPYAQGRQAKPYDEIMKRPVFHWSHDSRYAITQRLDLRDVNVLTLMESSPRGGGLPKVHTFIDGFPGDGRVPEVALLIVDAHSSTIVEVDLEPIAATHTSPLLRRDLWWSTNSDSWYLVLSSRDWLQLSLVEIRPTTGETRVLVHEKSDRRIRPNLEFHMAPCVAVNDTGGSASDVLWFSERDGWGHLYLYDAISGNCTRQVTTGTSAVASIHRVDWHTRTCWASIVGLVAEDLYRETICSIDIDSGDITPLSNDDFDHRVLMAPADPQSHPWYVDAASTVSNPVQYTVRSWTGEVLADLGAIDTTRLESTGWRPPSRFKAKAADGETDVFGTIFYPPNFDANKVYPIIDHVYPGPQMHRSVPYFVEDEVEPYAALGMIGITIDGKGTPMRSREFMDASWRNLGAGSGLEDHVAAIQELATTYPWMDASNVAIHGRSAGGYATALAMELFPDFYKVGIAAAGRFEGRMVMAMIMEAYDDPTDAESWKRSSAVEHAGEITGKFLIVHGEMDVDCTIYHAYRLIDKMIDANRDFDLLVIPGDDHVFSNRGNYVERRIWDYLTTHVLHSQPPRGFELSYPTTLN